MSALTEKQERFVREYLVDCNATAAAVRAGYSPHTAVKIGSENLRKPDIQSRLSQLRAEQDQRTEVTADWVVTRLREEADRTDEGSTHAARVSALTTLAKIKGLIKHRHEHTGESGGPIRFIEIADAVSSNPAEGDE